MELWKSKIDIHFELNRSESSFIIEQYVLQSKLLCVCVCVCVCVRVCVCCCCVPGDPEGGAWARQERRDGRGRHHPEERLLHGGAQSEETLTDRPEKGRMKRRGKIISRRTDSVVKNPLVCLSSL